MTQKVREMSGESIAWNGTTRTSATVREIFRRPLVDLGKKMGTELSGIYSPTYDPKEISLFMSSYYESRKGVQSQIERIDLTDYYYDLISEALCKTGYIAGMKKRQIVLELGCGFGSATIQLLKLFPSSIIIASELSIAMLRALKVNLEKLKVGHRCLLLQLNAQDLDFYSESVDLLVGAAILHHLFDPALVIQQCARILKPGGLAIFFEPFENGTSILGIIYRSILMDKRSKSLKRKEVTYLRNCISTWQKMKKPDKSDPFFSGIDDKWIFTRQYFTDLMEQYEFNKCIIYPLEKSNRPFEKQIRTHIEGNNMTSLPDWIWDIVDEYENFFSDQLKMDFLTEGCIIFQK